MAATKSRIRIGTAGWSIPRQHADAFASGDSGLARYATALDAAEINSSFYRPHQASTYARWAAAVPADFRFSAKLPKTISHELALRGAGPSLDRFLDEVAGLGRKLGGLLLQLPPSLAFDARAAANFFAMLRRRTELPVTCEPRHPSWFAAPAEALLLRYQVGRAAADPARVPAASVPGADPSWSYFRWHGSPRIYYSAYEDPALEALAAQVRACAKGRQPLWVIFDNTAHGFAIRDALRLKALLARPTG